MSDPPRGSRTEDDPRSVGVADAVMFLAELALLAGWVYAGHRALAAAEGWVVGVALAVAVAAAWGRWAAPRSKRRLVGWRQRAFRVVMFVACGAALVMTRAVAAGAALAAVGALASMASRDGRGDA